MEKLEPNIFRHEQIMARALFEEMVLKGGCNFEMAANVLGTLPKGDPDRDSLENVLNSNPAWQRWQENNHHHWRR